MRSHVHIWRRHCDRDSCRFIRVCSKCERFEYLCVAPSGNQVWVSDPIPLYYIKEPEELAESPLNEMWFDYDREAA